MTAPTLPQDIAASLVLDQSAHDAFRGMPPSHQHEYLKWVDQAKKPETRRRRIHKMVALLRDHHANNQ